MALTKGQRGQTAFHDSCETSGVQGEGRVGTGGRSRGGETSAQLCAVNAAEVSRCGRNGGWRRRDKHEPVIPIIGRVILPSDKKL